MSSHKGRKASKVAPAKSSGGGEVGKKRRRPSSKHLTYKMAIRRILKGSGKTNAVQAGTYKIFDEMFGQVQSQIMMQVARLNNTNRKRKQTRQPGLKAFDIVNATMTLIDTPEERVRVRRAVQQALSGFHNYEDEQE